MEQALFRINSLEIQLECNTELTNEERERYQQELHTLKKGKDQQFFMKNGSTRFVFSLHMLQL